MLRALVAVHTAAGVVAVAGWAMALLTHRQPVGLAALLAWWVVAVSGLVLLARWLPTRGRHVTGAARNRWTTRQWVSIVAHVVVLAAVGLFTWLAVADVI